MLLLQYIDELQGNKYSNISHENGGCPPLQLDFLRRRTNQTRPSIGVLEDKKCSTTTKKNSDNPPLKPEIAPLQTDKCSITMENHDNCPASIPPEEVYQPEFDFIVKRPAEPLLRALRRCGVETLINDFLDTLFNLGADLINLQDGELRESSPLIYAGHEPIRQDQAVKEVKTGNYEQLKLIKLEAAANSVVDPRYDLKVRLQLRPGAGGGSPRTANLRLCEKIHSVEAREDRTCSYYLSTLDIFGLEPVQNTEFSICWDAAFFSHIISDGQRVLGSLTARATSLASNLVGLCEWIASNLLLLTQILQLSHSRAGSWNWTDVPLTSLQPPILQSVLQAAQSLFVKLAEWKHMTKPPSAQAKASWRNDVRQAARQLANVTTTITTLAEEVLLAETPNEQLRDRAKKLYFTSRELLHACSQAISCNKAIWSQFQNGYLIGVVGIGFGAPAIVCTAQKGVQSGIRSLIPAKTVVGVFGAVGLALSVLSMGLGVAELCNTWKYTNICECIDECLRTTSCTMFSCEILTRRLLITQDEPAAGRHETALQCEPWWRNFREEAIRITGEDPVTTNFTFHRHYPAYLAAQNRALKGAQERLDALSRES